jgi:hypothetical protein
MSNRRGRRPGAGFVSAGAGNSHRRDFDRDRERKRVGAQRRAGVPPCVAQNVNKKVRGRVDHFRLITEITCRQYEASQLSDALDVGQPDCRFHLSKQVERANACGSLCILNAHLIRAPTRQSLAILDRHLARDVEEGTPTADRYEHCRHVRSDGRGRNRQGQSELAEPLVGISQLEGV